MFTKTGSNNFISTVIIAFVTITVEYEITSYFTAGNERLLICCREVMKMRLLVIDTDIYFDFNFELTQDI